MNKNISSKRLSTRTLAAVTGTAALAGVLMLPAAAGAESTCSSHSLGGVQLANGVRVIGPSTSVSIPAGATVSVSASHSDSHADRAIGFAQPGEKFVVQFLDAGGNVIANSWASPDLADDTDSASWSGSLGSVTLPSAAAAIRAHHGGGDPHTANSFIVGSANLCWTPAPEPEPTTTTTEAEVETETETETSEVPETDAGAGVDTTPQTTPEVTPDTQPAAPAPAEEAPAAAPAAEPKTDTTTTKTEPAAAPATPAAPATETVVQGSTQTRQELPETGSETLVFAGIGSVLMAAGRGLIRTSKRHA